MLPSEKALTRVVGMMPMRKPTMVVSWAAAVYWETAPAFSDAGSMFNPRPGWTTLAMTRPMIRARVEKKKK